MQQQILEHLLLVRMLSVHPRHMVTINIL